MPGPRLEDVFKTSGVPTYTFVRPTEYIQLLVAPLMPVASTNSYESLYVRTNKSSLSFGLLNWEAGLICRKTGPTGIGRGQSVTNNRIGTSEVTVHTGI